jgi:hypothetical protein
VERRERAGLVAADIPDDDDAAVLEIEAYLEGELDKQGKEIQPPYGGHWILDTGYWILKMDNGY